MLVNCGTHEPKQQFTNGFIVFGKFDYSFDSSLQGRSIHTGSFQERALPAGRSRSFVLSVSDY